MTSRKAIHYRRLYPFTCASCGEERASVVFERYRGEVCRKCRGAVVDERQLSVLGTSSYDVKTGLDHEVLPVPMQTA